MQISGIGLAEDVAYIGGKQRQQRRGAFPIAPPRSGDDRYAVASSSELIE